MPTEAEVADRLRRLAAEPRLSPARSGLTGLADAVTGTGRDQWIGADLLCAFDPAVVITNRRDSVLGGLLHAAPALLVFVPLAITWYGIHRASAAFSRAVGLDSSVARRSFLELWDTGMAGQLSPAWHFHNVTLYGFVAVLTLFFVVAWSALQRVRTDARNEREEGRLGGELAEALLQATLVLAPHRNIDPARFTNQLNRAAAQLGALLGQATAAAELLEKAALDTRKASEVQTTAVSAATTLVGRVEHTSEQLRAAVTDLAERTTSLNDDLKRRSEVLTAFAKNLEGSAITLVGSVKSLEDSTAQLRGLVDTSAQSVGQSLASHASALGGQVAEGARMVAVGAESQRVMASSLQESVVLLGRSLEQSTKLLHSALTQGRDINADLKSVVGTVTDLRIQVDARASGDDSIRRHIDLRDEEPTSDG